MNLIKERKKKKCEGGSYITFNIKSSYSFLRSQVRYEQAQKKEKKKKVSATTIKKLRKTYIIPQTAGHKTQPDFY